MTEKIKKNKKISVVVLTFNPKWDKTYITLQSILKQTGIDLEIVIADDGSSNFIAFKKMLVEYFEQYNFANYKIIHQKKNVGIVCNLQIAAQKTNSKYIKAISPGDTLFSCDTLRNWLDYVIVNDLELSAGLAVWYENLLGAIKILDDQPEMPKNSHVLLPQYDYYECVFNMLRYKNQVHGASIIADKEILIKYMTLLKNNNIILIEDLFFNIAILDKRKIGFYPEYVVWYEFNTGVGASTSADGGRYRKVLDDDSRKHECLMLKTIENNNDSKINDILSFVNTRCTKAPSAKLKNLVYYAFHPQYIIWEMKYKLHKVKLTKTINKTFIESCLIK